MNKIKSLLVLIMLCLPVTVSLAQYCTGTTTCIADQHVTNGSTNWYPTDPSMGIFSNNNGPTSPSSSKSLYLWTERAAYDYDIIDGNEAFTCFTFEKGKTYRVCFWVRENSNLDNYGGSNIYKPVPAFLAVSAGRDVPFAYQGITVSFDDSRDSNGYEGRSRWEFISTKFTARDSFNSLHLSVYPYPLSWYPAIFDIILERFAVEVDDIRVTEEPSDSIFVTDNKNPISGCDDETQITINGMPAGARATWTPAVTVPNPTGSVVIARPCNTTTYKIEITDTNSTCGDCIRKTLYHTVNVETWADPGRIIYPAIAPCTGNIDLEYIPDPGNPCPGITAYSWTDPQGTVYPGNPVTVLNANAYQTGEWTLSIWNNNKLCAEEHKFNIKVGSCCISNPDFIFSGCNPVTFTNTGNGITNHLSTLWSFGDGTSSDDPSPVHAYNLPGPPGTRVPVNVCLTTLYEDGQGESCCSQICKTIEVCAGELKTTQPDAAKPALNNQLKAILKIYPNPSSGNFSLNLFNRTGSYHVVVRDKLRREVYSNKHEFGNAPVKIMLNSVSDGIYSVEVKDDKEQFVQQVTVIR